MFDLCGDFDFAKESLASQHGREVRSEHFDCYVTTVPGILGQVDRCHPACAQLSLDFVAVAYRGFDLGEKIGHWREIYGVRGGADKNDCRLQIGDLRLVR